MRIPRVEDLDSWKEQSELVRTIRRAVAPGRDVGFRDQIQRASLSVMAKIAGGFGRGSSREWIQFFVMSRGSDAEMKTLIYVSLDLDYLREEQSAELSDRCDRIEALLIGCVRHLTKSAQGAASRVAT